jgi:photosystem II stability/assembly factor-like uncharacterized protein
MSFLKCKVRKRFFTKLHPIILYICMLGFSSALRAQITETNPSLVNLYTEEEDRKYEEEHKNSAWFRAMSEPNADYFAVKKEYDRYFGEHQWESSKPRQLGESWLKTNIFYLDKNGRVQDHPPFEAYRHQIKRSMTVASTTSVGSWDMLGPVNSFGAPYASIHNHGGYAYLTRFDPTNTTKLFASFVTGGLWMTSNGGIDWTLTDANMPDEHYEDIDVCIATPTVVYAISKTRVIKSTDGGLTYANTGLTSATHTGTGFDIAVSPTNADVVVARWGDKIYRTDDGGVTWSVITTPSLPNHVLFDSSLPSEMLDWSTTDNNVVYFLSTSHNDQVTVYRSGDAGLTFSAIQTITLVAPANGLVVGWAKLLLPSNNSTHIYVAVGSGPSQYAHYSVHLYKLDNTTGAIAASRINMVDGNAPTQVHHGDMSMDRHDENKLAYGTYSQGKIHYSSDNGATFTTPATDNTHSDIRSIEMVGGKIAVGSDGEVVISTDGGVTCSSISNPVSNHELWGFGAAFKSDVIAVGTNHGPVMIKESHNGFDWFNGNGADQQNTDVNPLDDRYIHTRGYDQVRLFRSGPHQLAFEYNLLDIGGLEYFNNIHFHPNLYYTLITHHAGGFPSGNPNLPTWKNSLIRSDDHGHTLTIIKTFTDQVFREKICMTNPNVIYVVVGLTNNRLWKTTDGGTTWADVTPSLTESVFETHISDVAVSDVDPNEVWITYSSVQTSCKVLKSTDGGATWPNNLTGSILSSEPTARIVHQRGSNGGVYTANKDGVYYRNNTMADWALLGTGLPMMDIRWLFINYNKGKLRIGTSRGAWEHDLFETSPPKAQIAADKKIVDCPGIEQVQFRDYSTVRNATATWAWSFPGGTPSTSSAENPLISYAGTPDGVYDVSLTVTDAHGTDSQTLTGFIQVNATGSGCAIDTIPGNLLTLSNPGDYAQQSGALGITTNTITLSCWMKPNGTQSNFTGIISSGNEVATGMNYYGNNTLGYTWRNEAGSYNYNSNLIIPENEWSHVALVVSPTSATMYLNGVPATRTATHAAVDFSGAFQFGIDRGNTTRNFKGEMDEICIYNRSLSTDEIRELMNLTRNNPNAGSLPNADVSLVSYYQMNEGVAKPIFDKTGGKHASLVGGATKTATSTAPVGGGTFQREEVYFEGVVDFSAPGVELTFPETGTYPDGDIVVTRLNVPSDQLPAASVLPNNPVSYYIIRNYGINSTFDPLESMKFSRVQGTSSSMVASPSGLKLYKRTSNAHGATWGSSIDDADVVTDVAGVGSIEFNAGLSVSSFSQFSIEDRLSKTLLISNLRLQGAMPSSGTVMTTAINSILPLTDPYGVGVTAPSIPANAVDWVKIELRSGASPAMATTVVGTTAAFLLKDGTITGADGKDMSFNAIPDGNYYVSVSHRNHLKVITNATIALAAGVVTVDFATVALYTNAAITTNAPITTVNGVKALWGGDANGNGKVSYNGGSNDREAILEQVGLSLTGQDLTYQSEDVNMNAICTYNGGTNDRESMLEILNVNLTGELNQHHP